MILRVRDPNLINNVEAKKVIIELKSTFLALKSPLFSRVFVLSAYTRGAFSLFFPVKTTFVVCVV
jgi:hypothetical protein